MIKVSIIIPVYNCEQYLKQCIESVLHQTLKMLEVICIDDGSTDDSVEEIRKIMSYDDRVILFQQENKGPGTARNLGIKNAKGKYIAFLDADDYYFDMDGLYQLYEACETKAVSVSASLQWCINGYIERIESFDQIFEESEVYNFQNYQMDYYYITYLFSRKLLIEKEIYFPSYYRYEDPVFLVKALYEANRFTVVNNCLYYYRRPVASTRFNKNKVVDLLYGLLDNLKFAQEHNLDILFENTVQRLEYEYIYIIFKNFQPNDLRLLNMLIKINQVVCDRIKKNDYIIRPLQAILLYASEYEKKILKQIRKSEEIFLYGAGHFGQVFLRFLEINHLSEKVTVFIVSEKQKKEDNIKGIPIVELSELQREECIFITVGKEIQKEIEGYLNKNGYTNYETVNDLFLCILEEEINDINNN